MDQKEQQDDGEQEKKGCGRGEKDMDDLDSDDDYDDDDLSDLGDGKDDDGERGRLDKDLQQQMTLNKSDQVLPDVSRVSVKD